MKKLDFKKISQLINESSNILIIQADNPDGDSLASALSLEQLIIGQTKKAHLYCAVNIPDYLNYLPGSDRVLGYLPAGFDLTILVDCAAESLIANIKKENLWQNIISKPLIIIDHHSSAPTIISENNLIDPQAVATSQIIFQLAKYSMWTISPLTADLLAAAILSDSLGLTTESVVAETFEIMAELVDLGANIPKLDEKRRQIYEKSPQLIHYKGQLLQRVEFVADDQIAHITIPWNEIETYSPMYNPSMLVLEEMRLGQNTKLAIAFKQYPDGRVTAKIRANNGWPIAGQLAELFDGGGHSYASGFKQLNVKNFVKLRDQVLAEALKLIESQKNEII